MIFAIKPESGQIETSHMKTKIAVFQGIVLPILLYGSQAWVTYQRHIKSLEAFHHKCLRSIAGIRCQDMVPNSENLQRTHCTSITGLISP